MIVDDHEVVRLGLKLALEPEEDLELVGDFGDARVALEAAETSRPDVVLMDVRMPGMDGIEACRALRERLPDTKVVMLTSYSGDDAVFASIMADAAGYLLKNTPRADLLKAVRTAAKGESLLDPKVTATVLARLKGLAGKGSGRARPSSKENAEDEISARAASDATVTIMFTDIEGSAAMVDDLGDRRAREVIRKHNMIVRQLAGTHGGSEIKSMGDGFMLTFPSARSGIRCALEMQRRFEAANRDTPGLPLTVRIGMSVGEPLPDEEDLLGRSVIIAARINASAAGVQSLVSQIVHELAVGAGEFTFREAGDFELKGISGTHRLYEVVWRT